MSLDVYLKQPGARLVRMSSGIFIREKGVTKEITREEWDLRNPGHEPTLAFEGPQETDIVFQSNITHNLIAMADAAGLLLPCWHPEDLGITRARELAPLLRAGLILLTDKPASYYEPMNPSNGWGSYDGLVRFVRGYLEACDQYPDAEIHVWR